MGNWHHFEEFSPPANCVAQSCQPSSRVPGQFYSHPVHVTLSFTGWLRWIEHVCLHLVHRLLCGFCSHALGSELEDVFNRRACGWVLPASL